MAAEDPTKARVLRLAVAVCALSCAIGATPATASAIVIWCGGCAIIALVVAGVIDRSVASAPPRVASTPEAMPRVAHMPLYIASAATAADPSTDCADTSTGSDVTSGDDDSADDTDDIHEVEKIVRARVRSSGETEYLVKWVGMDCAANTWEPKSHILDPTLIAEFQAASAAAAISGAPPAVTVPVVTVKLDLA
jgi:hypothetical protein